MPPITIVPAQITLAATHISEMVRFYTTVFDLTLNPTTAHGTTLYRGTLHNTTFVLCPNTLAEVQADQSRHQFAYTVSDLNATVERVIAAGGTVQEQTPAADRPASAVIRDPDGNSLVFTQAANTVV